MRQVWKYPLVAAGLNLVQDYYELEMRKGAEIIAFQLQRERATVWALVDPDAPTEKRFFRLAGTGHDINDDIKQYIGTFQMLSGSLVYHLFEIYNL